MTLPYVLSPSRTNEDGTLSALPAAPHVVLHPAEMMLALEPCMRRVFGDHVKLAKVGYVPPEELANLTQAVKARQDQFVLTSEPYVILGDILTAMAFAQQQGVGIGWTESNHEPV